MKFAFRRAHHAASNRATAIILHRAPSPRLVRQKRALVAAAILGQRDRTCTVIGDLPLDSLSRALSRNLR